MYLIYHWIPKSLEQCSILVYAGEIWFKYIYVNIVMGPLLILTIIYNSVCQPWHYWHFVPDFIYIYFGGQCPVHFKMFSSILGLCLIAKIPRRKNQSRIINVCIDLHQLLYLSTMYTVHLCSHEFTAANICQWLCFISDFIINLSSLNNLCPYYLETSVEIFEECK